MIWYQYIFLVLGVSLYSLSQLHLFGKLKWQHKVRTHGFFGKESWVRKYPYDKFSGTWVTNEERFFGSTTFLVSFTDFYHACQALQKVAFSLGIFGITWSALIAWICWTWIQYGCFKLFSK